MKTVMLVALWGVSGACSSKQPEPPPPPPPGEGIELVTAGAPPLRPLRYHLAKGVKTPIELAMDLDLAMGSQGGAMPSVVLEMEVGAEELLPDGSARIRTKVVGASARDRPKTAMPTEMMNAQVTLLAGIELTATLAPDGRMTASRIEDAGHKLPPQLAGQLDQLTRSLEQVAMPLPDAAVGVGAKWRNRKVVVQNNVKMATITTVELVAIHGDQVTFKSESQVTGADQKVEIEGTLVAISKVGGGGAGGGVIDLGRMTMTGELELDFHFDMAAQGQTAPMAITVAIRLGPAKPSVPGAPIDATDQGAQSAP